MRAHVRRGGAPVGEARICAIVLLALAGLLSACGGGPDHARSHAHIHEHEFEWVGVWYTVDRGDSVSAISARHNVPIEDLVELNGIEDPDKLEVGQALFLYGVEELLARKAATSERQQVNASKAPAASSSRKAADTPPKKKPADGKAKPTKSPPTKTTGRRKKLPDFIWPMTAGRLTSGFGKRGRRMHKGIDLAAKVGTPIFAVADGKVIYSDNKQRGYGNLVIIQHAHDCVTVYAHNRRNLVDEGDRVRQGTPIAELGNTGRSTGPHLHFEIRLKRKAVDPLVYLPAR